MKRKRKLGSFTLVEVLVAMTIIAIGSTAAVTIYSEMIKNLTYDEWYGQALRFADNYMTDLYLSRDLGDSLFSTEELTNIQAAEDLPLLLEPEVFDLDTHITMYVNKNIRRWSPLLVDVGIEMVITYYETNRPTTSIWLESTFSESYITKVAEQ